MSQDLTPRTKAAVDKAVAEALRGNRGNSSTDGGAKVRIDVPTLIPKNVDVFLKEVKVWDKLTRTYSDEDKALMLWSKLPTENAHGIKEKIDTENLTVQVFIDTVKKTFKPNEDVEQRMIYREFCVEEDRKRRPDESMMEFIARFEKMSQKAEKNKIKFGKVVLSFKILEEAGISEDLVNLCLSSIDTTDEDQAFEQCKGALMKYA